MLCVNEYPQDYVDECRSRVKRQLAAYRGLIAATRQTRDPKVKAAVESFESVFFNHCLE